MREWKSLETDELHTRERGETLCGESNKPISDHLKPMISELRIIALLRCARQMLVHAKRI